MIKALNNRLIIRLIRYIPFILVLILSIITTLILYKDYSKSLETNRTIFYESLIKKNKEKLQTRVFTIRDYIEQEVSKTENLLKSNLKEEIKKVHQMMISVYEQYKNKKTRNEIIEIINTVLRDMRFNDNRGYFLIITNDGTSILHPLFPEDEGLNISLRKDVLGKTPFLLLKNAVLQDDGFTSFHFFHALDKTIQRKKIVYGEYFKPYDLIVATGEYVDDFENALKNKILKNIQKINYGNNEYPFLYDNKGNILVSFNNGQTNGKNIFNIKNIENLTIKLKKFMSSTEDSKFIKYNIRDDENKNYLKLSFFEKIPLFNWIVATGFNIDEMHKIVLEKEKELQKQYKNDLYTLLIFSIIGTLFLLLIFFYLSKVIEKRFIKYQESLENQKIKYQNLLKLSSEGIFLMSLKTGKLLEYSDTVKELLGYSEKELNNLSVIDWDKDINNEEEYKKLISRISYDSINFERTHIRKNGSSYIASINAVKMDVDGKELLYASVRDVSNTKEYEKRLEEQNERLITLKSNLDNAVEIATLGIWEWDTINDILIWSDITYDIFGVDKKTHVNLELVESIIYKDDLELHREQLSSYSSEKESIHFEYRIVKNDEVRIISAIGKPIIENDKVIKMTGVVQDITDYKRKEEALLKAQKIAKIGEYELDLDTRIAHWSDKMVEIFGVKGCKDRPGTKFLKKIMYDEDWKGFESSIKRCVNQKVEHFCRYRVKRPIDGETIWIECRGEISDKNKLIGTIQNITQSKTLEIERKQKDELLFQQSKMAAMGEMIGNIAHQWRQPLSMISTAATGSKLQKEMGSLTDEEFNLTMDKVNNSAQYLSQTIDDFRDFFSPSNNKENKLNIADTISKTLQLISAQFIAKDMKIIQNVEEYELISIENELIQVLINILNNARDALLIKENQRRLIFINTYKKNNIAYIEIIDNAGGIEEDILDRIFEPYFTTKHQSLGTGIGLYMSQEIIHKHLYGTLTASNESYSYEGLDYTGAKFKIEILGNKI